MRCLGAGALSARCPQPAILSRTQPSLVASSAFPNSLPQCRVLLLGVSYELAAQCSFRNIDSLQQDRIAQIGNPGGPGVLFGSLVQERQVN